MAIKYSVRVSKRAKRLQLKINRLAQVEVVTPQHVTQQAITSFVSSNIRWIKRHQDKILAEMNQEDGSVCFSTLPPTEIIFPFLDKAYQVDYFCTEEKVKYRVKEGRISVYSNDDEEKKALLKKFVHGLAKEALSVLLNEVSATLKLPYNRLFIKAQKTRWGSCSSKKNINLNRNLLFLTPIQVKYLIVHELCHTVHLNHSVQYWQLVSECLPEYKQIDHSLKSATKKVPIWALS